MTEVGGIAGDQLLSIIERVERLTEERNAVGADIKEVFAEAKGNGFDVPTIKKIIKIRATEPHVQEEQDTMLELYKKACGMASQLDLFAEPDTEAA